MSIRESKWFIIGNPEHRRVVYFNRALKSHGLPPASIISYLTLLNQPYPLEYLLNRLTYSHGAIIKIESPAEFFELEKALLIKGANNNEQCALIENLSFGAGKIHYPNLWYQGYQQILKTIVTAITKLASSQVIYLYMNPADIIKIYDRKICWDCLTSNSIPMASCMTEVVNYEHLRSLMTLKKWPRVFIKSRYGGAYTGVIAYQTGSDGEEIAQTTITMIEDGDVVQLVQSFKMQQYKDNKIIAKIINKLCEFGVHVEEWIAEESKFGYATDIRLVTLNKKPQHRVVRLSKGHASNPYLEHKRLSFEETGFYADKVSRLRVLAEKVANVFPDSPLCSMDLMFPAKSYEPIVLGVNAFGDLLQDVAYEGKNTYEAQVHSLITSPKDFKFKG